MPDITTIKGVGPVLAKACAAQGYQNAENIASAKVADLTAVPGIQEARARQLIKAAKSLLRDDARANTAAPGKDKAQTEKKKARAEAEIKIKNKKNKKKNKKKKNKKKKKNTKSKKKKNKAGKKK